MPATFILALLNFLIFRAGEKIPPGSTLVFEVELLKILQSGPKGPKGSYGENAFGHGHDGLDHFGHDHGEGLDHFGHDL